MRDFVYSEEAISKQREELALNDVTEKELWVCAHCIIDRHDIHKTPDGATSLVSDQLLGILPDTRPPQNHLSIC